MTVNLYFVTNFVIVPVGMSIGIYLFFFLSGWRELAQHFKAKHRIFITFSRWQTGSVGSVNYHTLNVGICQDGLFLSITPPFYPALLIPWDAVTEAYIDSFGSYRLDIGNPYITRIILPRETLEAAEHILATKR